MNIDDNMFHKEMIFLNIHAESTDEVLDYVYEKAYALGLVTSEFKKGVKEREHKYPTGLPGPVCDIAVPHTDPEYVIKPFIAVVTTKQGVPFVQMATRDLYLKSRIIFVLGFKTGKYQVKMLQTLVHLFLEEDTMAKHFLELKEHDCDNCYQLLMNIQEDVINQNQ